MTFVEWVDKYGIDSARRQFGVGDHLVLVVHPGKYVVGVCGRWRGSQPLGMNPDVEYAKQQLRDALGNCFETEETIVDEGQKTKTAPMDAQV